MTVLTEEEEIAIEVKKYLTGQTGQASAGLQSNFLIEDFSHQDQHYDSHEDSHADQHHDSHTDSAC